MSIAEKLTAIAENEQKVYDAGVVNGRRDFWDGITGQNTRTNYERAFRYWNNQYFDLPYQVKPTSSIIYLFAYNESLKKVESKHFDLSGATVSQTNSSGGNYALFDGCEALEEIEDIGMPAGYYNRTFYNCEKLHTIAVLKVAEDTVFSANAFSNCAELENITIEGTIGNSLSFPNSPQLTHGSLMSVINALKDYAGTSTTKTLTIGTTNQAKLTDAEKAIATQKGWTIA